MASLSASAPPTISIISVEDVRRFETGLLEHFRSKDLLRTLVESFDEETLDREISTYASQFAAAESPIGEAPDPEHHGEASESTVDSAVTLPEVDLQRETQED